MELYTTAAGIMCASTYINLNNTNTQTHSHKKVTARTIMHHTGMIIDNITIFKIC